MRAVPRQLEGQRAADARRGAGNQGDFSVDGPHAACAKKPRAEEIDKRVDIKPIGSCTQST